MFAAIISMIGVLFIKQMQHPPVMIKPQVYSIDQYSDAINISLTSYGFFVKMFPVFSEMKDKRYKTRMTTNLLALLFVFIVYTTFAYLAINQYGNSIKINIISNFAEEDDYLSFGATFLFFMVLVSVIPYNFFPCKLFIMNLFLEYHNSSFSRALKTRM
jgi:amino acid permease